MIPSLTNLLIAALLFCLLAYGLYWVCTRFFPSFPPALWICGVILLILLLSYATGQISLPMMPLRR